MTRLGEIDLLNQRGQRRGFAATGRTADQDQPVVPSDEFLQVGMEVEFFNGRLKGGQQSDGESDAASRLQDVDPATNALQRAREVGRTAFQKILPVDLADDIARPFQQHFGRNRFTQRAQ